MWHKLCRNMIGYECHQAWILWFIHVPTTCILVQQWLQREKNSQMWKYIKVYTGDILYGLECTTCSTHWDIQFIIFACCRDVRYAWNENDGFTLTRPPPRSKLFLIKNVIYNFKFWKAIHFLHQKGIRIQMPLGNPSLDVKQLGNPVNMHPTEHVIAH